MATISSTTQVVSVDPVGRLEGHLKVNATIDFVNGVQQVVDAQIGGNLFRGIEKILANRSPLDAPDIAQRICGVCPTSQGLAAVQALESLAKMTIPDNARIMRNLVLAADLIHSHILHFYVLALLDFVDGPAMPPWQPSWSADKRISGAGATALVNNYVTALDMRRQAHEMGALFGGRLPHSPAFVPGGFTTTPRQTRITSFQTYVSTLLAFVKNVYMKDVDTVANTYSDYYSLGAGSKNLLAYGCFELDSTGNNKFLRRGLVRNGSSSVEAVDVNAITERVNYSYYDNATDNLNPSKGQTNPVNPKAGAYSWMKAPRYQGLAFEVGALARMWVNGDYRNGISVMDRHQARVHESLKVLQALAGWANQLSPSGAVYSRYALPANASAYGLTEAPRGALGHWVTVTNSVATTYQIVSPTCWNGSPRDGGGTLGTIEQALIGVPVRDLAQPVEVVRVIHSFDPCLACSVHMMRPGAQAKVIQVTPYGCF